MKRILLADDHSVIHQGLKSIINERADFQIVDSAYNGKETLIKIKNEDYDLLILDISMPGRNIYQLIDEVKDIKPDLPIIVYTIYPEEFNAVKLMEMGINGYLNKSAGMKEIIFAIKKVLQGGLYISSNLSEYYANFIRSGSNLPKHKKLSGREYQIFLMLASGKNVDEVSKKLKLSKSTVAHHRNHIMRKIEVNNTAQLTLYAINEKLIDSMNVF